MSAPPSLTLLADRRAREGSAQAAPRLEARGPVPKRRMGRAVAPTPLPLSGLTADERRVHQILLGALARANVAAQVGTGLTYSEKKHLVETLDLGYLDAEIGKMGRRGEAAAKAAQVGIGLGLVLGPLVIGFALANGSPVLPSILAFVVLMAALIGTLVRSNGSVAASERQQIYEALRELALVVDGGDAPVSEALLRADALIDAFSEVAEPAPAATSRTRVQS